MLKLIIKFRTPKASGGEHWDVRQEFQARDIVEASQDAISIRRVDGKVTTHRLTNTDWVIAPK